jgi:holo-[acyl-carrier protein] synthase
MILGIGNDIVDIRRIEKTIEKHGQRFIDRIFTDVEKQKSAMRNVLLPRKHVPRHWAQV